MKKITLAALIIASFAAATAQAQSNVVVYGVVDLGLAKTSGSSIVERENQASRLGFKGTEDLGNGLKAIFNLESEFKADTGAQATANTLFDRQAWVGLTGDFGTVYLGRTKDLLDGTLARVDPFNTYGVIGKINEPVMRGGQSPNGAAAGGSVVGVSRVSNSVTYNSPTFSGFVLSGQVVASEINDADAGYSVVATYDMGPASAHAGYQKKVQSVANAAAEPTLWLVGGGYKFGPAKITFDYSKADTDVAVNGEFKSFLIGLAYDIGGGAIKASYVKQKQDSTLVSGKETAKAFGLGYDYPLSKRTAVYGYAGRDQFSDKSLVQVGMTHKF
ncbi:porin [Janthinobacterium sp. RB2R34]|uniref:porin n=1 Tax=Janthinobacterium sp. RB2R34 TaxID=3424193 RepID=UPI003F22FC05